MATFVFLLTEDDRVRVFESLDVLAARNDVCKVTEMPGGHAVVLFTNGKAAAVRRIPLERDTSSPELSSPAPLPRRCESALSSAGALADEDGTSPLPAGMRASSPKSSVSSPSSFRTPERRRTVPACPDLPRRIRVSPRRIHDALAAAGAGADDACDADPSSSDTSSNLATVI